MSIVFGMLRIKNEERWIEAVLHSIAPICEHIFVFDDHSSDGTAAICKSFPGVTLYRSRFRKLDESRDKNFLLDNIMMEVPREHRLGNPDSPYWALAIDGDEVLEKNGAALIQGTLDSSDGTHAYKLPIRYLWGGLDRVRTDGVYGTFARPSLFRLFNPAWKFQVTPFPGNLHCASIPQELLHHAHGTCPARLWHFGYMEREDRLRKYELYNAVDPGNKGEDYYRHMVQGDVPAVPARARLKWAGPLATEPTGEELTL